VKKPRRLREIIAMPGLDDEIAAFNEMRGQLEADHHGEWAVVHGRKLFGPFVSFQQAATLAVKSFRYGPYLIRQIGVARIPLPVSLIYSMPDGEDKMSNPG
jgi:hypothetical protein